MKINEYLGAPGFGYENMNDVDRHATTLKGRSVLLDGGV